MLSLLDTTLRDGSYVVDFQFTVADTAVIAGALDAHGVPFIEAGHGLGLGAHRHPRHAAAATDVEYAAACAATVQRQRWGMFCIPGIATLDDLARVADLGLGFVRIGTNVTETDAAVPFLAAARARGLFVFANLMKTYALEPPAVAERACRLADAGADVVCVVDSAGGMLPEDVARYVDTLRARVGVAIGFHGHDNLGLAVANTLVAVERGATVIDTSLRGMGRSAGNASTERTLFALLRRGLDLGIDPVALLTLAEQRIDPLLQRAPGDASMGTVSGYAQFHSAFQPLVDEVAAARGLDRRDLVIAVTAADKVEASRPLVEAVAERLAAARPRRPRVTLSPPRAVHAGPTDATSATSAACSTDAPLAAEARAFARRLHSAATRRGVRSVLNLVQRLRPGPVVSLPPTWHEGPVAVIATIELGEAPAAECLVAAVDGLVDDLLVDVDAHPGRPAWLADAVRPTRSGRLLYSDLTAWAGAVLDLVTTHAPTDAEWSHVALVGRRGHPLTDAVRALAAARGRPFAPAPRSIEATLADPTVSLVVLGAPSDDASDGAHVGDAATRPAGRARWPRAAGAPPLTVIDAWVGAADERLHAAAHAAALRLERPDMRSTLQAELLRALDARARRERDGGCTLFDGIPIAAGGAVAPRGTIVVDSIAQPRLVHGVADGRGRLLARHALDGETARRLQRAEDLLLHSVG